MTQLRGIYVPDGGEYRLPTWPVLVLLCLLGYLHHPFLYVWLLDSRRPQGFKRLRRSLGHELAVISTRLSRHFRCSWIPIRSRPRSLDQLPVELLHEIFLYACTDGGQTGCSLALVSRDVRALSRASRFHSVTLAHGSGWKMRCFLREFDKARRVAVDEGSTVPKVRHLCLLADAMKQSRTRPERVGRRVVWYPNKYLSSEAQHRIQDALDAKHHASVEVLLQKVAGDLETLCLISKRFKKMEPLRLGHDSFPNLRELWFSGVEDGCFLHPDQVDPNATPSRRHVPRFPVLSRFHIDDPSTHMDFRRWSMDAPDLVSLRVLGGPFFGNISEWNNLSAVLADNPSWPRSHVSLLTGSGRSPSQLFDPEVCRETIDEFRAKLDGIDFSGAFVPYYARQDVEEELRELPSWMWEKCGIKWLRDDEGLLWRDWVARIAPIQSRWHDGIFTRDFWADFTRDSVVDRERIAEEAGKYYVEPLIKRRGKV